MSLPPPIPLTAHRLLVPGELAAVRPACAAARDWLAGAGLPGVELDAWELALAESLNNAVLHARPDAAARPVTLELLLADGEIEARVHDHTGGMDWPEAAELPPDDAESGRGVFIVQSLMDATDYLRGRTENCLVLRRRFAEPAGGGAGEGAATAPDALAETVHTLDLMTEELASAYESLSAIFRFSAELQGGTPTPAFLQRWLEHLRAITASDWFVLRLSDPAGGRLQTVAASPAGTAVAEVPVTTGAGGEWVEGRAAGRREDLWLEPGTGWTAGDPLAGCAAAGWGLVHPIVVGGGLLGVLSLGRAASGSPYAAGQVSVIHTFGDFLGLQLHNLRLAEAQVGARLAERELEIAARIQRSLLPAELPPTAAVSVAVHYRSARVLGGDFYDVLPLGGGRLLAVVADVMGKGIGAALFALMFRSLVRARTDLAERPGELLAWLNAQLFPELDRAEMFITAQLVYVDRPAGIWRVANAGHPPLLLADDAGALEELGAGGPPLGIQSGLAYPESTPARPVRLALLFTDGLTEARNPAGALLGPDPVRAVLAHAARERAGSPAVRDELVRQLTEFEQGAPVTDDLALLVIASN